jgi:polyisoprenoid-binding protein YceI
MKLFLIAILAAVPALAERIELKIDPADTEIKWILGDTLHTVRGTFKLKQGDLWFDPDSAQAGGLLVVDATSGESGSNARDRRMHANILESARYPEIVFRPDRLDGKIPPTGNCEVQLHGMFTIHGGTHELLMKVKTHIEQQKLTAAISFTVPYVKWGMKNPSNFLLKVRDFIDIDILTTGRIK